MRAANPKRTNRNYWFLYLLLSLVVLSVPFLNFQSGNFLLNTFGRLHPLFIHFPLAFILLIIAVELLTRKSNNQLIQRMLSLLYQITLLLACLSAIAGAILSASGEYGDSLLQLHSWGGITSIILLLWTIYFRNQYLINHDSVPKIIYRFLLISLGLAILYTGHQGGSLTHGSDFLTQPFQQLNQREKSNNIKAKAPEQMLVYEEILLPILQTKCISCHNPEKSKGGLILANYDQMLAGGDSEKSIVHPGDPGSSELIKRVTLDPSHDDFMPPEGKKEMSNMEVELFKWWIMNGASLSDTLGSGPEVSASTSELENFLETLSSKQALAKSEKKARVLAGPKLIKLSFDLGLVIEKDLSNDSAFYTVSMRLPPKFVDDHTLEELMPYKDAFSKVSLVGSEITDEGLYYIGQMNNLKEIILSKTCITGEGLTYLKRLKKLKMLNLSHTRMSNQYALELTRFPKLNKVFLFNTLLDNNLVEALDQDLEEVQILLDEGPYF